MNTTNPTVDDLDLLDFDAMTAPNFVTQVDGTLVLTPTASFTGVVDAWTTGDAAARRDLFLAVGNAHLAEVQLQRLHPGARQHVLDRLPDPLPVEHPLQYTRMITAAIKDAPPAPPSKKDKEPPPPSRKLTPAELEAYRRCLLVRAAAHGGALDDVPVVVLSMGVLDFRTPMATEDD